MMKKDIRIAFFTSHINKSLQWLWYNEALEESKIYQIHIIINPTKPLLYDDLKKVGVEVYYLSHRGFFSHFANLFMAIRILARHQINIVHTSLPYGNLIGQSSAYLLGIKNRVTTCENASWGFDFNHTKQKFLDRYTFNACKYVIATSEIAYNFLQIKWGICEVKLVQINHGLKLDVFNNFDQKELESLKNQFGLDRDDFVIGMIARLEFWKGHKYAISAIANLVPKYPNIKLLIFGSSGPEQKNIETQIEELELSENVIYMGFMNNTLLLYQLFNIHLHVPIGKYVENGGITIIEGMISATPQVLTLSGYAYQSAKHEYNCLVVDYKDSDTIASAIEKIYNSRSLGEYLSENAKMDAINEYGLNNKVRRHVELYQHLHH